MKEKRNWRNPMEKYTGIPFKLRAGVEKCFQQTKPLLCSLSGTNICSRLYKIQAAS